jgi:cupin 2 domain-containing protein
MEGLAATTMRPGNLFADVPQKLGEEEFVELFADDAIRIERIVSTGHASPADAWYDQDRAEWVLLLAGSAGLLFEGDTEPIVLKPGSYLHIGAHQRHRVAWTDPNVPTVWLAVHHR